MENEEARTEQHNKITEISHALLNTVVMKINEDEATAHELMTVLCNTFWAMILVCSHPKDVIVNVDNAFKVVEESYKLTKTNANEIAWKHFSKVNGVGNS